MLERIHKILAHAGYGSRRACEDIIAEGRVTLNGRVVTVGDKADLSKDDLRVDGGRVRAEPKVYFIVNKPGGYISTSRDPMGRRKVGDLLPDVGRRVYPVGRLDADSRGLVLLTNDGELTDLLTHPSHQVSKTYEVEVDGLLSADEAQKLVAGVWLSEGRTSPARVKVLRRAGNRTLLEITLREGRNRQVRRMLARLGHKVRSLTRTRLGSISIRGLGVGKFRQLTDDEVESLRRAASAKPEKSGQSEKSEKPHPKKRRSFAKGRPPAAQGDKKPRAAKRKTPPDEARGGDEFDVTL